MHKIYIELIDGAQVYTNRRPAKQERLVPVNRWDAILDYRLSDTESLLICAAIFIVAILLVGFGGAR